MNQLHFKILNKSNCLAWCCKQTSDCLNKLEVLAKWNIPLISLV